MKKIIIAFSLIISTIGFAQITPTNVALPIRDIQMAQGSNRSLTWFTSPWGNGFGPRIINYDPGSKTLLNFQSRHNSANWSTSMSITSRGDVGIGTTNPGAKFHVQNGITNYSWTPITGTAGIFESSNASRAFLTIVGKSTAQSELWFGDENTQNSGRVRYENSTDDLEFWTNNTQKMTINSLGNVGIGTANPSARLALNNSSDNTKILQFGADGPTHWYMGIGTANGDYFHVGDNSNKRLTIKKGSGNIGIGTANPSEKLTVKGKILCGEVEVVMESTIPADYVFQKYYTGASALKADYVMPSLVEVEAFTKANHHLPEVPSAATIKEDGLQLKEMTTLLLQKVEELTLYTIEQEKRIKSLEVKLVEKN